MAGQTVSCPNCQRPLAIAAPQPDNTGVESILKEIGVTASEHGIVCPACQQVIRRGSSQCDHCHYDLQTASIAKKPEQVTASTGEKYDWKRLREGTSREKGSGVIDEDLTGFDIALCLFCCPLSMLYGIVMFARGNSKGLKLVLMSYILPLLGAFIRLIVEVLFFIPQGRSS